MRLQLWLTKDPAFGDPVPINDVAERGRYVVFDYVNWQRESVCVPLSPFIVSFRFTLHPSPPYHYLRRPPATFAHTRYGSSS